MKLEPWAKVSGRLIQAATRGGTEHLHFSPGRWRMTKTRFRRFVSDPYRRRRPFSVRTCPAHLRLAQSFWIHGVILPFTSSESVPLECIPESIATSYLVVKAWPSTDVLWQLAEAMRASKRWSINLLVSRAGGVDWPEDAAPLGFDPAGSLQLAWLRRPISIPGWLPDGTTSSNCPTTGCCRSRVKPSKYDLVIKLYEEPAGCLVETIGGKVVR